jgi:signal transduction histidine kinase
MASNLASRKASRTLLLVIVMLLLPLLIFGAVYIQKASQQIKVLDNELLGSKIGQLVYPVLLSETHEVSETSLAEIALLEAQLGISPNVGFAAHYKFSTRKIDANHDAEREDLKQLGVGHEHEEGISGYLKDVTDKSGIILDSEPTSYYLGYALMVQLPDLLLNLELLMGNSADNQVIDSSDIRAFARFQKLLGQTGENVKGLKVNVSSATNYSETPERFTKLLELVDRVEEGYARIVEEAGAPVVVPTILPSIAEGPAIVQGQRLFLEAQKFSINGFRNFDEVLAERRSVLKWSLYGMLSWAICAAFISLAMAYRLVGNTLKQLDVVEEAKNQALRINDEVAALNTDLASNVAMLRQAQDTIVKKGKMEQLGQLTATVAHELRNPLGAVRTSTFLIQRKIQGKELGIESQLDRINNGITRCDDIITQLLDYSRTKKITAVGTNLDDWMEQIITEESKKLPSSIGLECSLGLSNRLVPIDTARLSRAIINLLSNSVEAMVNTNTKVIGETTLDPKIWISTQVVADHAVISVRDNGCGISPENMLRIREPLFTTKNFGTGLGIPAIEQIAEQHGGHLTVESVLGQGATFSLHLPLTSQAELTEAA